MKIVSFPVSSRTVANCSITPRIVRYESAYSVLCRFALANVISGAAVVKMFKNNSELFRRSRARTNNLYSIHSVSIAAFERELGLSKTEIYDLFLTPNYLPDHWSLCSFLRYCPRCMEQGVHYAIFQFEKLVLCPRHKVRLELKCHFCGAVTPFTLAPQTLRTPFGCALCQGSLLSGGYRTSSLCLQFPVEFSGEAEKIYKTFEALSGNRLSIPLLHMSRVQADNVISEMKLSASCDDEEARFFSSLVNASTPPSCVVHFDFKSRSCQKVPPRPPEVESEEFSLLIEELALVLKALIRHECLVQRVPVKTVTKASDYNLFEYSVQVSARSPSNFYALVHWRKLWCARSSFRGRAAIGYAVSSWLVRFYQEHCTISLTAEERSWLAKHVFADEVLHTLTELLKGKSGLNHEMRIQDDIAYVTPCWAVEITDEFEVRKISYVRQAICGSPAI